MKRLLIVLLIAVSLSACEFPTPTPKPYPAPIGEIGHTAYPIPEFTSSIWSMDMPTCTGNIEYPSRVWMLANYPDDLYSETCIASTLAGSSVLLFDQLDNSETTIRGKFIGRFPPDCSRYIYRLNSNGVWWVQIMVSDPGGVTLCSIAPNTIERWRYKFLELWR